MLESKFSGKRWPVRIAPKEDELLCSWMARLAHAYGADARSFWSAAWLPRQCLLSRDIDICDDQVFMRMLADKTGRPVSTFAATSLTSYQGLLFDKRVSRRRLPWVMPVGVYAKARRQYGLQYCPRCLAEDEEPYFRRVWRLGAAVICTKHRVLLADRCRRCGAAVCPHMESPYGGRHPSERFLAECHACGADRGHVSPDPPDRRVRRRDVRLQSLLEKALNDGHCRLSTGQVVPSFIFFTAVRRLMLMLLRGHRSDRFRRAAKGYFGIEPLTTDHIVKGKTLETFDAINRLRLLGMACHLLRDWPSKYDDFCREDRLWSTMLFPKRRRVVDGLETSYFPCGRNSQ